MAVSDQVIDLIFAAGVRPVRALKRRTANIVFLVFVVQLVGGFFFLWWKMWELLYRCIAISCS